jgi:TatD DNase family protein
MFIDSHAHIDGPQFDADRDEVVKRAVENNVGVILNVGTGDPSTDEIARGVEIAAKYEGVYSAGGVHPHDASGYTESTERLLEELLARNTRMIALGEIGLDFHYNHSPQDIQKDVFRRQLRLAGRLKRPVIIHTRSADTETVAILREELADTQTPGVMHCFSGGAEMAKDVLDLGFMISFSGNVTFKSAGALRDIAQTVPIERILIETDCPFLTPVPFRGRRNEPARVIEVARCIAEVRNQSIGAIEKATTDNFVRTFGIEI